MTTNGNHHITCKQFLDRYTLPLSMLLGVVGFPLFRPLMPTLPSLIFLMLFFTFCKVNPIDLRLHLWHWLVLVIQLVLSVAAYYLLLVLTHDACLAQGVLVCLIMPTATAAPIIAGKLGGSIQNLTTFTLLSNIATAIVVPAFFPIVNPAAGMSFIVASSLILSKVGPLLLGPFFAAWLLRIVYNAIARHRHTGKTFMLSAKWASLPFWIWAATLVILMADITHMLLYGSWSWLTISGLCVGALITCLMQFYIGKWVGQRFPSENHGEDYHDVLINPAAAPHDTEHITRITAGQAFGQKNTTLGVWMAQTYLNPLSAIGPAAYIIWQNIFNSVQLAEASKVKSQKSKVN